MPLKPGEITVSMGDTHIYLTHLEQVRENLTRQPYPFPKLVIKKNKNITDFVWDDIALYGYKAHPKIAASMVV